MDICDFLDGRPRRVLFARPGQGIEPQVLYGGVHRLDAGGRGALFKDHFTWHLVLEGEAEAEIDGVRYRLSSGDGLLYLPRAEKRLRAAAGGCSWSWIGFDGAGLRQDLAAHGIDGCRVLSGLDLSFRALQLSILSELAAPGLRHEEDCSARMQLLLNGIVRRLGRAPVYSSSIHDAVTMAQRLITTRAGTGLTVADLAQAVGLERSYFSRLFRQQVGCTVRDALAAARLRLAEGLLADPSLSIRAVAELSGFEEYFSFHRFFKQQRGVSPSAFRDQRVG